MSRPPPARTPNSAGLASPRSSIVFVRAGGLIGSIVTGRNAGAARGCGTGGFASIPPGNPGPPTGGRFGLSTRIGGGGGPGKPGLFSATGGSSLISGRGSGRFGALFRMSSRDFLGSSTTGGVNGTAADCVGVVALDESGHRAHAIPAPMPRTPSRHTAISPISTPVPDDFGRRGCPPREWRFFLVPPRPGDSSTCVGPGLAPGPGLDARSVTTLAGNGGGTTVLVATGASAGGSSGASAGGRSRRTCADTAALHGLAEQGRGIGEGGFALRAEDAAGHGGLSGGSRVGRKIITHGVEKGPARSVRRLQPFVNRKPDMRAFDFSNRVGGRHPAW